MPLYTVSLLLLAAHHTMPTALLLQSVEGPRWLRRCHLIVSVPIIIFCTVAVTGVRPGRARHAAHADAARPRADAGARHPLLAAVRQPLQGEQELPHLEEGWFACGSARHLFSLAFWYSSAVYISICIMSLSFQLFVPKRDCGPNSLSVGRSVGRSVGPIGYAKG